MAEAVLGKNEVDIADVVEGQERGILPVSNFVFMTFLLCCLIMLADGFDNQALNWVSRSITDEWGIERAFITPVLNVSILGWMTGSIGFAMIADKLGRRNSVIVAVLLFGLFTLMLPFARNLWELGALRFLATIGVGGAMPMAIALISDYTKAKNRGLAITMLYLGYTAGSSIGGFLAAEMITALGWRSVFYLGGGIAVAIALVLYLFLPESARYLLVSGGSREKILGYAKKLRPSANYSADTVFVINEQKKVAARVPLKHLFSDGRAAMTTFLWFAFGFSFFTHFFLSQWLANLLTDYVGTADAVRTQSLFQLGAGFGFIFGYLIDKKGIPVMTWTNLLAVIPVAAIGFMVDSGTTTLMALSLISGILVLGGNIGTNAISGMIYPTFIRSTATGAAFAVARIGAILGPLIAGYLIYIEMPIQWIFLMGAVPMIPAGIACWLLSRSVELPKDGKSVMGRGH